MRVIVIKSFVCVFAMFFIIGCTNAKELDNSVVLSLSETNFSASKEKSISLYVSIANSSNLKKIVIRKYTSNRSYIFNTIYGYEIKESTYNFNYNVTKDDPDEICFVFQAFNNKDQIVDSKKVVVDNRSGIYVSGLKQIARVTGKSLQGEVITNPNNTAEKYDVYGTDLGIIWKMSDSKVGIFFGDTNGKGFQPFFNGGGGNGSNWRSNVVAFSEDLDLEDGLSFSEMTVDSLGKAREICAGGKANPLIYQTSIPTSAIRINGADYVHYMNIYDWSGPTCSWLTNFSSLYVSYDSGKTWIPKPEVKFKSLSHFSQIAYAKKDGIVYMIGTRSGRGDAGYLGRFKEKDILDMRKYEYWNGESQQWIQGNEEAATPVIPAPVGEASLMFHEKYKRWILTYNYDYKCDSKNPQKHHAILYLDTDDITTWSKPKVLVFDDEYPGLYCAYMHPLKNNEDKLYFLMSLWGPYNVFLMSVDMKLY